MNVDKNSRFILHVSDFHLTEKKQDLLCAKSALKSLVNKLADENIKIDYLVHTGDIIDSSDLYEKVARKIKLPKEFFSQKENSNNTQFDRKIFNKKATETQKNSFNMALLALTTKRFKKAENLFKEFISDLNIPLGSVVICCGNHDVLQLFPINNIAIKCKENDDKWVYTFPKEINNIFVPFETFLNNLETANSQKRCKSTSPIVHCNIDNLNFLILNTNWKNPLEQKPGYFCIRCDYINTVINEIPMTPNTLNIVLAHKPLYEICEKARLSYQQYFQTLFMSNLRKFIGTKGIYLCGDKHTRSIGGSKFHDIPHYIGGEPLRSKTIRDVEYNLLEINNGELGLEKKIHLTHQPAQIHEECLGWECGIRPQDDVISKIYELSKVYIIDKAFGIMGNLKSTNSWESIYQEANNWDDICLQPWYDDLNRLYQAICKYRINGSTEITLDGKNIFDFICERLNAQVGLSCSKNVLNIRGEYSSGKSTFLGLFFIYLLNQYSLGKINFIPAYFNVENEEMSMKIKNGISYFEAVKQAFDTYSKEIQHISVKEHQPICFIIDGLDEQDCWSYSTEDSIGRTLLNSLAEYNNSWYTMSFSQHRLPCFKNTMPNRKYNDSSDIMYFNPIDVREKGLGDSRFLSFVKSFLKIQKNSNSLNDSLYETNIFPEITDAFVKQICEIIRQFRRLTVTPGFMYDNFKYIIEWDETGLKHKSSYVSDVYNYYIEKQHEICLDRLGYNFVKYAPAMAYLFSYKGYTYERFRLLREDHTLNRNHPLNQICKHFDKIYHTFLFIKKHKDAREYLIALHYNRELRYYVEYPTESIDPNSILYEFMTRNIAVMIRKLWTDTNKFIIACEILLQRDELPACMQSMLVYCLAHLRMYDPIRDRLRKQLQDYGKNFLLKKDCNNWIVNKVDSVDKLNQFITLSLKHSMETFRLIDSNNSIELVNMLLKDEDFRNYNRQFQMLYYEDLSIKGEESRHALNPATDIVYKGFDFHNCFYYLYVKLSSSWAYPLREFDMFTLWDLIYSRLLKKFLEGFRSETEMKTFFYREKFDDRAKEVLIHTLNIFTNYLKTHKAESSSSVYSFFEKVQNVLQRIILIRENELNSYQLIMKTLDDINYNKFK